jgi:hypothetical protein
MTGLDSATATEGLAAIRRRLPRAVLILATHELPARPDVLGPPGPGCRWINIRRRWTCSVLVREPWSVRC